jgi:DNA-binding MarR family transcriptional regulator
MRENMSAELISIPFRGNTLFLVEHHGQPYTPMRPIVEGMGLNWKSQYARLRNDPRFSCGDITTTGSDGKRYKMVCLPLRKLFGWLMTINPNRVREDLRQRIIEYQNECDDALWNYWTQGVARRGKGRDTRLKVTNDEAAVVSLLRLTRRRWGMSNRNQFGDNGERDGYNAVSLNAAMVLLYFLKERPGPEDEGDWRCRPIRQIADKAGLTYGGTQSAIQSLLRAGLLERDTSCGMPHCYRVPRDMIEPCLLNPGQRFLN